MTQSVGICEPAHEHLNESDELHNFCEYMMIDGWTKMVDEDRKLTNLMMKTESCNSGLETMLLHMLLQGIRKC